MMKEWIESSGADVLSSQTRRVAKRFALVAAAGELAAAFGVLPWDRGEASRYAAACFRSFLADFETSEDRALRLCEIPFQLIDSYPTAAGLSPNTQRHSMGMWSQICR